MRLLPNNRDHGWAPFAWLIFLVFFYVQPVLEHPSWGSLLLANVEVLAFLVLYFGIFWVRSPLNYLLSARYGGNGFWAGQGKYWCPQFSLFLPLRSSHGFLNGPEIAVIALGVLASAIAIDAAGISSAHRILGHITSCCPGRGLI